jgi:tetratricopeptide (TPR) repeat protein
MSEKEKPAASLTEEELLEKLRHGCENENEILWDLAILYAKTHRPMMAFSYLQRLTSKCSMSIIKAICYMKIGIIMEDVKDYEAAIMCYSRVYSLKSDMDMNRYFMNNNIGYCLNQLKRYKEAELYCRDAIKINPTLHNAYIQLGVSLEGQEQFQQAAQCYSKAAMICPQDGRPARYFGDLWQRIRELG